MPLSNSLNELVIRSHQMNLHAVTEGLYNMMQGNDEIRDMMVDWILDLQNIDNCLSYFINYERTLNGLVNEARLENAKIVMENHQIKDINKELTEKIERLQAEWERLTSK